MELGEILRIHSRGECESRIRQNTRFVYLGDRKILCIILGRYKFFVRSDDVGFSPHIILDGFWEFWLTQFMAQIVRRGDHVLDIGANHGYYSILLSDLVAEAGMVYAVEPNPSIYELLHDSLAINGFAGRSKCLNIALSNDVETTEKDFFVPKGEPKNGRFLYPGESPEALKPFGETLKVPSRKLRANEFERLDFVKIDVEGAELLVLESLRDVIETHNPKMVIEVNFGRGYTYQDIVDATQAGESLMHLDFDGNIKELSRGMSESERIGDDWLIYREIK